ELETQLAIDFPTVRNERLSLSETEEAHRIECLFAVSAEVSEEGISERVAGGARVSARVEINLAGVSGARVLIDAIARDAQAGLQSVIAAHPRDGVAAVNVGCWGEQRTRRAKEAREAVDGCIRNRILKASAAGEQLLELEAVGVTLPEFTVRRNSLGDHGDRRLGFINKVRRDQPRVRELHRGSGTFAKAWNRRQLRGDKRAERIDQLVLVVNVTTVERLLVVDAIVNTQQIFAVVERVWLLESYVVADRAVGKDGCQPDRGSEDIRDRGAVCGDAIRRDDVTQGYVCAAKTSGAVRSRTRQCAVWIFQQAVVVRADDAVSAAQSERKIAVQLRERRHGATLRRRKTANVLPLLATEEEQLVLDYWTTEAITKIIEAQCWSRRREKRTRVEFVVS